MTPASRNCWTGSPVSPRRDRSILGVAYDSERWQVAGLWEDPSVRIGWIHGLSNMMHHPQAFHFLDQAGLTKPLLQLQIDPSLFVASAANHLLARLLTFKQPATTSHTTQGNGLTVPPNTEEEELAVTMATSPGSGRSVTMEILKHLESSLESDSHTQVLQGLRLLALTLPELEAPLWGSVIRRVLRPLEGLVLEGRGGGVTQPLMDVLLATYSPPDLRQKAVAVLLGPLQMVTGVTLLDRPNDRHADQQTDHRHADQQIDHRHADQQTDHRQTDEDNRQTDTDQDRQTEGRSSLSLLLDHLNQKPSCISLLCLCVSSTLYITDMSKAPIGCSKASTNLIGCSKVQRCGLDSLASLNTCSGAVELVVEVFHVLLQYLQNPDSDPTDRESLMSDLLPVLRKRVCDVRWEVRDSTLEFLGQLCACEALACTVTPILLGALCDQESYEEAVSQLLDILSQDSEGFARRAVVQFFISWLKTHPSSSSSSSSSSLRSVLSLGSTDLDWEVKVHTLELVDDLMEETLPGHQETELWSAPPHYGGSGGTNLLTHTNHTHPYAVAPNQPSALLTHTPTDTHTPHTHASVVCGLSRLVELGVVTALLNGLFDCDRPVALKACSLLLRLRDMVCPRSLGKGAMTTDDATATVAKVTFDLRGQVWGREVMRKLQEKRGSDWVRESREVGCDRLNRNRVSDGTDGAGSEACDRVTGKSVCEGSVTVCEVLWWLGLEERRSVLSQSSDHVQNSPLSLLQDI
ncbi:unnamed protein product [Coregonus sp. 'balchen']|nr:unnamed protein product [Coregonus sp. 'balchen']